MDISLNSNLLDVISDAGITVEWVDCKTGRFIKVNQYSAEMHGMSVEEIEGMLLWDLDPVFTEEMFYDFVEELREKKRISLETEHIKKSGEAFPIEVTVTYRGEEKGAPEHFIAFIKDISERRQMEDILVQKNAELEELMHRISHDLRSPLNSALRLSQLTLMSLDKGDMDKAKKQVSTLESGLKKLEQLVTDLLELASTQGREEERRETIVDESVDMAIDKLQYMEGYEGLNIDKDIRYEEPVFVQRSRLNNIIENMISNAIKYQDPDEDSPMVGISSYEEGEDFYFEVRDNGLGIDEQFRPKMFKMFERFHPSVSIGTGLGLFMMKKSAEILGGDLEYEPREKGSIFRLKIPTVCLEQGARALKL